MEKNEIQEIIENDSFVLIDFFATWCMPCKMQSEILKEFFQDDANKIKLLKIDVDENEEISKDFGIVSIPTLFAYKNGELVKKYVGVASKEEINKWFQ